MATETYPLRTKQTMKFELNRPTDYSDETLLNEIRRVSKIVDKPLTRTKFDKNSKYNASTIEKRFGGWLSSLKKADLDETYWHTDNLKISTAEIIAELRRVSDLLKSNSFTRLQFAENSSMTPFVFKGVNSYNKVMKLAGLEIPTLSRRYTDNECFENLLNVWIYYGRQPHYREMKDTPSVVGPKAYVLRWGSWIKALLAFLDKVNSDISETNTQTVTDKEINTEVKPNTKLTTEDRREIPLGLRFNIYKRDRYRCLICGRSPATTIDIELHIDHVVPFSQGGKTRLDNLRTLCNECNIGKSDKIG